MLSYVQCTVAEDLWPFDVERPLHISYCHHDQFIYTPGDQDHDWTAIMIERQFTLPLPSRKLPHSPSSFIAYQGFTSGISSLSIDSNWRAYSGTTSAGPTKYTQFRLLPDPHLTVQLLNQGRCSPSLFSFSKEFKDAVFTHIRVAARENSKYHGSESLDPGGISTHSSGSEPCSGS